MHDLARGEERIIFRASDINASQTSDTKHADIKHEEQYQQRIVKNPAIRRLWYYFDNIDEYSNLWQVNNLYIFMQDETGIFIIDQHAAHERIIYEKMIRRMFGEKAIRQRLLFPIVVDLPHYLAESVFSLIEENIKEFEQVGFNIKTLQNSIVIDEIPIELEDWDGGDIFIDLIKQLQEEFTELEDFRDSLAKSMACKAAVKAGKRLQKREMVVLIKDLYKCEEPFYCPHGRPLIVKIDYQELEKRFKRI